MTTETPEIGSSRLQSLSDPPSGEAVAHIAAQLRASRSLLAGAVVLGIAMSGFFDGILLHQILQWHHLLSLVPGEIFRDPRVQIYADGMFHLLMYGLALIGLRFVWRDRRLLADPHVSGRAVWAFVGGFGLWNVIDVAIFHWILRIHRIRLDVSEPLAWDLAWLLAFGIAPLLLALFLRVRGLRRAIQSRHLAAMLFGATIVAGLVNLNVRPGAGETAVLFRPGMTSEAKLAALARTDASLVAADQSGDLVIVRFPAGASVWSLYRDGAVMVGGTAGGGCLNYAQPT